MTYAITLIAVVAVSALMAMTGRGGGNFYVPLLVAGGLSMPQAAATAQCILCCSALSASVAYQKNRTVDWKLAIVIELPTALMALLGGYYAHRLPAAGLKLLFAGLLVLAAFFMLRPVSRQAKFTERKTGFWRRCFSDYEYRVNLWLAVPVSGATGLVAGMVGISGGSFKVPLMVLACGVPMRVAVGTSSAMVAVTALTGLIGHSAAGDFNAGWAAPMSLAAMIGGLIGSNFTTSINSEHLKKIFAYTTLAAAVFMLINSFLPAVD